MKSFNAADIEKKMQRIVTCGTNRTIRRGRGVGRGFYIVDVVLFALGIPGALPGADRWDRTIRTVPTGETVSLP